MEMNWRGDYSSFESWKKKDLYFDMQHNWIIYFSYFLFPICHNAVYSTVPAVAVWLTQSRWRVTL